MEIVDGYVVIPHTCPQLNEDGCRIYNHRPIVCAIFKPESKLCKICLKTKFGGPSAAGVTSPAGK
jgi:Fe-S-cluster containining protein